MSLIIFPTAYNMFRVTKSFENYWWVGGGGGGGGHPAPPHSFILRKCVIWFTGKGHKLPFMPSIVPSAPFYVLYLLKYHTFALLCLNQRDHLQCSELERTCGQLISSSIGSL